MSDITNNTFRASLVLRQTITLDRNTYPARHTDAEICNIEQILLEDEPEYFFKLGDSPEITLTPLADAGHAITTCKIGYKNSDASHTYLIPVELAATLLPGDIVVIYNSRGVGLGIFHSTDPVRSELGTAWVFQKVNFNLKDEAEASYYNSKNGG